MPPSQCATSRSLWCAEPLEPATWSRTGNSHISMAPPALMCLQVPKPPPPRRYTTPRGHHTSEPCISNRRAVGCPPLPRNLVAWHVVGGPRLYVGMVPVAATWCGKWCPGRATAWGSARFGSPGQGWPHTTARAVPPLGHCKGATWSMLNRVCPAPLRTHSVNRPGSRCNRHLCRPARERTCGLAELHVCTPPHTHRTHMMAPHTTSAPGGGGSARVARAQCVPPAAVAPIGCDASPTSHRYRHRVPAACYSMLTVRMCLQSGVHATMSQQQLCAKRDPRCGRPGCGVMVQSPGRLPG